MWFKKRLLVRFVYGLTVLLVVFGSISLTILLYGIESVFDANNYRVTEAVEPFPISVNPLAKRIEPNTIVDEYYATGLASVPVELKQSWLERLTAALAPHDWYQQLASPVSRIFVIWPGERREEVVEHITKVLHWNDAEAAEFVNILTTTAPALSDGTFYPGQYVSHRQATPQDIATLINERFIGSISARYTKELEAIVPLEEALIIASLLEREASDFQNMREVSGVIWNRRFIDMPLQLDATLQYVRGSRPTEPAWWPAVNPNDKFIDSPYNTYKYPDLPPTPIANVTAEAVLAALNPIQTDCLFYFHDSSRNFHCSPTYEEHVGQLRSLYGRGR